MTLVYVFIGAGVGGVLRYLLGGWVNAAADTAFPLGTLVVNVIGCVAIGFVGAAFAGSAGVREEHRVLLVAGVLGGFTTFSTFGYETFGLVADRRFLFAALNLVLANGLGLTAVWLGARFAARGA